MATDGVGESDADRLLHNIIEGGDVVGRDDTGRIVLAIEPCDFEQVFTFGAVAVESEATGAPRVAPVPPASKPCRRGARHVGAHAPAPGRLGNSLRQGRPDARTTFALRDQRLNLARIGCSGQTRRPPGYRDAAAAD